MERGDNRVFFSGRAVCFGRVHTELVRYSLRVHSSKLALRSARLRTPFGRRRPTRKRTDRDGEPGVDSVSLRPSDQGVGPENHVRIVLTHTGQKGVCEVSLHSFACRCTAGVPTTVSGRPLDRRRRRPLRQTGPGGRTRYSVAVK